ncbi:MAG: hypothetical protein ACREV5_07810 [Steroidobacter sp.]
MNTRIGLLAALTLLLAACGGSDGDGGARTGPPPATADISLLFMGNSHTSANDLTGMVAAMVRAGRTDKTVASVEAPGWMFLEERLNDTASIDLLRSHDWSFVILQAQKYSSSGQFSYSTAEAKELIRMARESNAIPIMFPEWPRRDVAETQRIYDLHVSIAQEQPACVAPIGQAWDLSLVRHPALTLHADDGNHSAPAGAFLAALVLYATVTGLSPLDLPLLSEFPVGADAQAALRAIADETVRMAPPRLWCPEDPFA